MHVVWVKLRKNGEIERERDELDEGQIPSPDDGKLLSGVGYKVVGYAMTPHLPDKYHIFVHEQT